MTYTQQMTFNDLCAEVISLRFTQTQLPSVQRWVNDAYRYLWHLEEWNFRYAVTKTLAVTANSDRITNLPADYGADSAINKIWRSDGTSLVWKEPDEFWNLHANQSSTGSPQFFTVINGAVYCDPISSDTASDYVAMYEKAFVPLVNDVDVPGIPSAFHYGLVSGALLRGLPLYNDFTYQFLTQQWSDTIEGMRRTCLADQRGGTTQFGRDSVEALPTFWGV